MNIENLIKKLEGEIKSTAQNKQDLLGLERLKLIAKRYSGDDQMVSFKDIAERIKQRPPELKILSGWKGLDDILDGFRLQQVVVVSALTKSGKTSFLMDLTTRIRNFNPTWFPFEESAEELVTKFLDRGEEPPHGYTPREIRGNTLEWIESRIIESIAKHNSRIVFIDQLDFIVPLTNQNRSDQIGQTMRELKGMAKKWNVVIFLICHLVKAKMDSQPTLEDLKGSSSIGQEADTVILLWRETKRVNGKVDITNNLNVSIQANRRTGRTGNVNMVYKNGHFYEEEWRDDLSDTVDEFTKF